MVAPSFASSKKALCASALLLCLAACQCFTSITASGSLGQGVFFQIPDEAGGLARGTKLYHLVVYTADAMDETPVWRLDGAAQVASIQYGVVPPGMMEARRARLLEPGKVYFVGIQGGSLLSSPRSACGGKLRFKVGADGTITQCAAEGGVCG